MMTRSIHYDDTDADLPVCGCLFHTLYRDRYLVSRRFNQRFLCGRWWRASSVKRYGHRSRLDECRLVYFDGGYYFFYGPGRRGLSDGLDGWLCLARPFTGTLSA